jgi:D-alanyl-lipoteichoic acid acyltransferase DltB (MBOAT superfamily)
MLLIASYVFYGWWDWRFLSLLFFSSVIDFFCGRMMGGRIPEIRRRDVLAISLFVNLGLLLTFKYFDFFSRSFHDAMKSIGIDVDLTLVQLVLPVGISFYTFQTLSYTIDVYRRKLEPTDRFFDFLLYVSFFPQLVAGPIERAANLLPQILRPRSIAWSSFCSGAQLTLVGFFKKMVIADNLAPVVDAVYRDPGANGLAIVIATYAFAFQIYCDFSGYTDIARGVARMMGFELCLNFDLPYFATNPSDFWRRWHISLSSWFRDYVYVPLGGNRTGRLIQLRNLVLTMFLAGLWHGASWHFVLWGLYHGALLVAFEVVRRRIQRPNRSNESPSAGGATRWPFWVKAFAFFQLTCIGWLIFRVNSLGQLTDAFWKVVNVSTWQTSVVDPNLVYRMGVLVIPLLGFQVYQHCSRRREPWVEWPRWVRVVFYSLLFYSIVLFGTPEHHEFIYFQF